MELPFRYVLMLLWHENAVVEGSDDLAWILDKAKEYREREKDGKEFVVFERIDG
jgi:hypothetical protein